MTGIESLRALAAARDEWILGGTLADIADQIERERECERDTIENLRLELGEARDDAAWVREHGGLERVKDLLDWVVGHCSTKQQLDFDFWLSGRVMHELGFEEDIADRDEVEGRLLARLMPGGMEWLIEAWPKFEDDAPVKLLDDFERYGEENGVSAVTMYADGSFALNFRAYSKGERVNRPAPKVLDADGSEIRVGDTVYHVKDGSEMTVCGIDGEWLVVSVGGRVRHDVVTHRAPVLAADGEPLEVGQTVYLPGGTSVHVTAIGDMTEGHQTVFGKAGNDITDDEWYAAQLTHERPDSWQRIEDDAGCTATKYNERRGTIFTTKQQVARDLVRRCKELARKENNNE